MHVITGLGLDHSTSLVPHGLCKLCKLDCCVNNSEELLTVSHIRRGSPRTPHQTAHKDPVDGLCVMQKHSETAEVRQSMVRPFSLAYAQAVLAHVLWQDITLRTPLLPKSGFATREDIRTHATSALLSQRSGPGLLHSELSPVVTFAKHENMSCKLVRHAQQEYWRDRHKAIVSACCADWLQGVSSGSLS